MSIGFNYDGGPFPYDVAPTSLTLASRAEMGETVFCGLTPEDPTSALAMKGHRPFTVEESACSQPRLFTGWTTERASGRSIEASQFVGTTARAHDVTIVDLNALFGFRMISGADGNRPSETFAVRLAWILGSDYLSGLIADTGHVGEASGYSGTAVYTMDAADYREGYPATVLNDLMERTGLLYNYFAFWDPVALAVGLWLGRPDDAVSDTTLRVSNVIADVDNTTTFAPDAEASVVVSPTDTYSEVTVRYAHGTKRLFRTRASTATNYIRRGTTIDRPWAQTTALASRHAELFLDAHANEEDRITVTIIVPAAAAGLAVAGQRMSVKFSHLTGYTSFASMRIMGTTLTPTNDNATHYALGLELAAPRPAVAAPSVVQSAFGSGAGSPASFKLPATPTLGNTLVFAINQRNAVVLDMTATYGPAMPTWTVVANLYDEIAVLVKTADGVHDHNAYPDNVNEYLVKINTSGSAGFHWGLWEVAGLDISTLVSAMATGSTDAMSVPIVPPAGGAAFEIGVFEIRESDVAAFAAGFYGTAGSGWTEDYAVAAETYHPGGLFEHRVVTAPNGTDSYPATGTRYEAAGANWYGVALAFTATPDIEISLPTPPEVTAITDQINNLEYLGDIPLGLPEL